MPMEQVKETQKAFAGKKNAEVIVYPGAVHGCEYSFQRGPLSGTPLLTLAHSHHSR